MHPIRTSPNAYFARNSFKHVNGQTWLIWNLKADIVELLPSAPTQPNYVSIYKDVIPVGESSIFLRKVRWGVLLFIVAHVYIYVYLEKDLIALFAVIFVPIVSLIISNIQSIKLDYRSGAYTNPTSSLINIVGITGFCAALLIFEENDFIVNTACFFAGCVISALFFVVPLAQLRGQNVALGGDHGGADD